MYIIYIYIYIERERERINGRPRNKTMICLYESRIAGLITIIRRIDKINIAEIFGLTTFTECPNDLRRVSLGNFESE